MKRSALITSIILLVCFCANAQSQVGRGSVQAGVYSNPDLGFSYKYPKDWVVHGDATNERIKEAGQEKLAEAGAASGTAVKVALAHTYFLLTVFRQPVGTPGITVNPAIMVLAENVEHAPGIKTGKDYLLNIRAVLQKTTTQFLIEEPKEYTFAGRQFFRDDSANVINGVRVVHSNFATITNGYALVFMFLGESEQAVEEMAKSMETFALTPPVRTGVTIPPPAKPKPN